MRSISFVAGEVEICSYDSMVSCQWPNVLPGVSTLPWSFVVCVLGQRLHSCFNQLSFRALLLKFPIVVQILVKLSGVCRKFSWGRVHQWHMVVICVWCALFVTSQF